MERRLRRLQTIWRYDGERVVSEQERQLARLIGHAIDYPSACAPNTAADQLRYWREMLARSRADTRMVERALVTALVARGCREDEVIAALRGEGLDAMLEALAVQGAELAAKQDEARERDAAASEAAYKVKKERARVAYFATHPFATDRDFEANVWPKYHWRCDDADELAAMLAAAE